jgi:hypothetical protein
MTFQYIAQHLLLSLSPCLVGSILSAVVGYGIASRVNKLVVNSPLPPQTAREYTSQPTHCGASNLSPQSGLRPAKSSG